MGKPNADMKDAIQYTGQNPPPVGAFAAVIRWVVGFVGALLSPSKPKQ